MSSDIILEYLIKTEQRNIKECKKLLKQKLEKYDREFLEREIQYSSEVLEQIYSL